MIVSLALFLLLKSLHQACLKSDLVHWTVGSGLKGQLPTPSALLPAWYRRTRRLLRCVKERRCHRMPLPNVGQPTARLARTAATTARLPLLIVDDEPSILDLLRETLQDAGYPVLTASNGREALAIAQQTQLALVLADVMMPFMDGNVLSQRLRADPSTQHLPVLLMTATRYVVTTDSATALIAKPFDLDALVALVRRYYLEGDAAVT